MAIVACLAAHLLDKGLGLRPALSHVQLVDAQAAAQGLCLCAVFVLLLRYRRYKWRRIRPERIMFRRGGRNRAYSGGGGSGGSSGSGSRTPGSPGTLSPRPSTEGPPSRHISSLLATEAELVVLAEVKAELYKLSPRPALLPEDEPLLDVQLIRFLKEHGPNAGKIFKCFKEALDWRQKNLPDVPLTDNPLDWLSSSEMVNGAWACKFATIGIYCGKSKIGCPVKIERLGKYDLQGLQESDPNYRKKFNEFYLSLIEFLQQRLDRLSLEEGRLVQTYEIFDLAGLGYHMMTMTVINFAKDILLNYSAHYPSSFRKAALVNAPHWLPRMWRMISHVLPNSVKAKVRILGNDYYKELQEDLSEEALAWVESSNADLIRAPHPPPKPPSAAPVPGEEPLDGGPVLVEDDD